MTHNPLVAAAVQANRHTWTEDRGARTTFAYSDPSPAAILDLTGLWLDLEDALGSKVDVVSSRGLRPRVAAEVMRDAISL